jgi:hypothetical protein
LSSLRDSSSWCLAFNATSIVEVHTIWS